MSESVKADGKTIVLQIGESGSNGASRWVIGILIVLAILVGVAAAVWKFWPESFDSVFGPGAAARLDSDLGITADQRSADVPPDQNPAPQMIEVSFGPTDRKLVVAGCTDGQFLGGKGGQFTFMDASGQPIPDQMPTVGREKRGYCHDPEGWAKFVASSKVAFAKNIVRVSDWGVCQLESDQIVNEFGHVLAGAFDSWVDKVSAALDASLTGSVEVQTPDGVIQLVGATLKLPGRGDFCEPEKASQPPAAGDTSRVGTESSAGSNKTTPTSTSVQAETQYDKLRKPLASRGLSTGPVDQLEQLCGPDGTQDLAGSVTFWLGGQEVKLTCAFHAVVPAAPASFESLLSDPGPTVTPQPTLAPSWTPEPRSENYDQILGVLQKHGIATARSIVADLEKACGPAGNLNTTCEVIFMYRNETVRLSSFHVMVPAAWQSLDSLLTDIENPPPTLAAPVQTSEAYSVSAVQVYINFQGVLEEHGITDVSVANMCGEDLQREGSTSFQFHGQTVELTCRYHIQIPFGWISFDHVLTYYESLDQ